MPAAEEAAGGESARPPSLPPHPTPPSPQRDPVAGQGGPERRPSFRDPTPAGGGSEHCLLPSHPALGIWALPPPLRPPSPARIRGSREEGDRNRGGQVPSGVPFPGSGQWIPGAPCPGPPDPERDRVGAGGSSTFLHRGRWGVPKAACLHPTSSPRRPLRLGAWRGASRERGGGGPSRGRGGEGEGGGGCPAPCRRRPAESPGRCPRLTTRTGRKKPRDSRRSPPRCHRYRSFPTAQGAATAAAAGKGEGWRGGGSHRQQQAESPHTHTHSLTHSLSHSHTHTHNTGENHLLTAAPDQRRHARPVGPLPRDPVRHAGAAETCSCLPFD